MVRSKEELLQCANAWVAQAKSDIRNQIVNFMQMSGVDENQLADILAISRNELRSLIETNNEVTLSTFAKLLIATDNVLEIKPLNETPLANAPRGTMPRTQHVSQQPRDSRGRFTSTRTSQHPHESHRPMSQRPMGGIPPFGGMPIPTDRHGRPLPPPPGFPMPPMGENTPQRFGGMPGMAQRMQRTEQPEVGGNRPIDDLAAKARPELVQMIRDNFWDGEIDAATATRGQLIDFLNNKRACAPTQRQNRYGAVPTPQPMTEVPVGSVPQPTPQPEATEEDASLEEFRAMLNRAVEANPHLRDVISQYQN